MWATEGPCNLGELIKRQLVCKPRGTSWKGEDATCCTSTENQLIKTSKNKERWDHTLGKVRLRRVGRRHAECELELHFTIPVYSELEICLYQNKLKWFWLLKVSVIEDRFSVMQGCRWKEQVHAEWYMQANLLGKPATQNQLGKSQQLRSISCQREL